VRDAIACTERQPDWGGLLGVKDNGERRRLLGFEGRTDLASGFRQEK